MSCGVIVEGTGGSVGSVVHYPYVAINMGGGVNAIGEGNGIGAEPKRAGRGR